MVDGVIQHLYLESEIYEIVSIFRSTRFKNMPPRNPFFCCFKEFRKKWGIFFWSKMINYVKSITCIGSCSEINLVIFPPEQPSNEEAENFSNHIPISLRDAKGFINSWPLVSVIEHL